MTDLVLRLAIVMGLALIPLFLIGSVEIAWRRDRRRRVFASWRNLTWPLTPAQKITPNEGVVAFTDFTGGTGHA